MIIIIVVKLYHHHFNHIIIIIIITLCRHDDDNGASAVADSGCPREDGEETGTERRGGEGRKNGAHARAYMRERARAYVRVSE